MNSEGFEGKETALNAIEFVHVNWAIKPLRLNSTARAPLMKIRADKIYGRVVNDIDKWQSSSQGYHRSALT
jgi:hypothetical protein